MPGLVDEYALVNHIRSVAHRLLGASGFARPVDISFAGDGDDRPACVAKPVEPGALVFDSLGAHQHRLWILLLRDDLSCGRKQVEVVRCSHSTK